MTDFRWEAADFARVATSIAGTFDLFPNDKIEKFENDIWKMVFVFLLPTTDLTLRYDVAFPGTQTQTNASRSDFNAPVLSLFG